MAVDLSRLHEMHPLLSHSTSREYAYRAAVGLARHGHLSGIPLRTVLDGNHAVETLQWRETADGNEEQLDFHRVTEDAAEAIALAVVHTARGWTVRRRLQRGEFADWLLMDTDRQLVAMEVAGVDTVDRFHRRLREKCEQVAKCHAADTRVACVAELGPPGLRLSTT